jgi:hypothetical protein
MTRTSGSSWTDAILYLNSVRFVKRLPAHNSGNNDVGIKSQRMKSLTQYFCSLE